MKRFIILLLMLMLVSVAASADLYVQDDVTAMMDRAWQTVVTAAAQDPVRQQEVSAERTPVSFLDFDNGTISSVDVDVYSITDGVYTMRYTMDVIGEPDENGLYPLYICLHGGGYDDTEGGWINNL